MTSLFTQKQLSQLKAPRQKKEPKVYTLNCVLPFGKYQRQMIRAIAIQDPDYLLMLQTKYKVQLSMEVIALVQQMRLYSR